MYTTKEGSITINLNYIVSKTLAEWQPFTVRTRTIGSMHCVVKCSRDIVNVEYDAVDVKDRGFVHDAGTIGRIIGTIGLMKNICGKGERVGLDYRWARHRRHSLHSKNGTTTLPSSIDGGAQRYSIGFDTFVFALTR